jgi:FkbM family methyltransferase
MFTRVVAEGVSFELLDPDASMLRDALPGCGYEPGVCAVLGPELAKPGCVFFDVGALYGFFAVWADKSGASEVVAFEPGDHYADVLEHNLRLNGCEHVRVERIALAERTGVGSFAARTRVSGSAVEAKAGPDRRTFGRGLLNHVVPRPRRGERVVAKPGYWRAQPGPWLAAAAGERLGLFTRGADQDEREISLERLDDWVARTGVRPTVMKIDIHGGEVAAVRGMRETLAGGPIELVVEVHTSDLLVSGTHEELVCELEAAGLEVCELRGFRGRRCTLIPLVGRARRDFCDQRRWTATELYFMRCLHARRRS